LAQLGHPVQKAIQMNQQTIVENQSVAQMSPIDPKPIVEHGESPTSIILAIAILISILVSGITGLVRVIVVTRSGR
jgi:hypothetical protein